MVPNGWEKHPIGKLCKSIVPGRNKPKVFDGDIPWVTTPEILGKYIPSKIQKNFISQPVAKECGAKIVPKGAVVIAAVGELGLTAVATEEIILNQQLHAFVCPNNLDNEYLAYFLSTQKAYMDSVASKTTIPYMNKTNCESIPILLPPLPEQQKIAKILSTWDKAIATTEKLIATSQQQKKALMQQLLAGKKRLVNPETGKVFEGGWKVHQLQDICCKTISYGIVQAGEDLPYGIPCVRVIDLSKKAMLSSEMIKTSEDIHNSYRKTILCENEIMMALRGEIGLVKKVTPELIGANITRGIARLAPRESVDCDFLLWVLRSNSVKNDLLRKSGGSALQEIALNSLRKVTVLIPTLPEQQKIASVLTTADKEVELLQNKLAHLKDEKKALMQQLLTGKRRVKI